MVRRDGRSTPELPVGAGRVRDTRFMFEPLEQGLFPTVYLTLFLSQRAAAQGDLVTARVEGTDAGSMIRGKILWFERIDGRGSNLLGLILGTRDAEGHSRWVPVGTGPLVVTMEGYVGTMPLHFDVPPVPDGDYRVRLDLVHQRTEIGAVQQRTATLYAPIRVLQPS
jgi:hypothetical protein